TKAEAVRRTWSSLAERWSTTEWILDQVGLSSLAARLSALDLVLAILGVVMLAFVALRMPVRSGHLLVLLLLVVQVSTIVLAMRTDFERYYLPIVLSSAVLAGSGVGLVSAMLRRLTMRGHPVPERTPVGQMARSEGSQP
ncbi:MAG: hypothetical protein M3173_00415, partial [Chloroflexota bacterium]|nr:hypothetical protein [Chloroflexota bacterium]